jgi:2-isopropylmalate synthase
METEPHSHHPRGRHIDFAQKGQAVADGRGGELRPDELLELFRAEYLDHVQPLELVSFTHSSTGEEDEIDAVVSRDGQVVEIRGSGNGPIAALVHALGEVAVAMHVRDYHEHAMSAGEDAKAVAYVEAEVDDEPVWGVGIHSSVLTASLRAVVNAVNRALAVREAQTAAVRAFDRA